MAITDFPFRIGPINNITPFTYRDGVTYLEILYLLRDYINDTLRPEFDGEMERIIEEFNAGIENAENTITEYKTAIDAAIAAFELAVNSDITAHETAVDARMDTAEADIATAKTGWQTLFNQFMADVEAELAALSDSAMAGLINTPSSATAVALAARDTFNILDYGVVRGTAATQTAAIKAALDSKPGKAFYFPPGDYRLDTELVIGKGNSLILAPDARIYAGAAMNTLITYLWDTSGFAEDKALTGGLLDGNLNANRILSIGKVIRFTLTRTNFKDGIQRGLVTEAGLGAELFAYDLRFYNSGITNVANNIAIESNMGDSHYRDIIIRDWTTAVKDVSGNRWDRVHPWISQDAGAVTHMTSRYPTSIGFDITGASDIQACVTDTYRTGYKLRTNGTSYTAPPRLLNARAMWANDPILPTALATANPAQCLDNTDEVGVISDRFTMAGPTAAPVNFINGPITNLTTRNTFSYGYVLGKQGTTSDSFDYRNGVQQGTFTFTPTVYGSNSAGTQVYGSRSGRMVVTGDTVSYFIRIAATLDSTTALAGSLRIGGLPIPNGSTNVRDGAGVVGLATNVNTTTAIIYGSTTPYITLMTMGATGSGEVDIPAQSLRGKVIDLMVAITVTHFKA